MLRYIALGLALLCGCKHQICTYPGAFAAGEGQGRRGEPKDDSVGGVCKDKEDQAVFRKGFDAGYPVGLSWRCDAIRIRDWGRETGMAGEYKAFRVSDFQTCQNVSDLEVAYDQGYPEGVAQYCSPARLLALGKNDGLEGKESVFMSSHFAICTSEQVSLMRVAYEEGLNEGLRQFCSFPRAEELGLDDGRNDRQQSLDELLVKCEPAERRDANARYLRAHEQGQQERCEQLPIENEARETARLGNELTLPQDSFSQFCLKQYPALMSRYEREFLEERERIVASQCTYEQGVVAGQADALSQTDYETLAMPAFCSRPAFDRYSRGYSDGWEEGKDSICSPAQAHEAGIRDAEKGVAMDYTPPYRCPKDRHRMLEREYDMSFREERHKIYMQCREAGRDDCVIE